MNRSSDAGSRFDPPPSARSPVSARTLAIVLGLTAVASFLGALVVSDDPDMFHHLAMGRVILSSGFPRTEPFLFPQRGEPSGAPPYWLGSVVIHAWHAAFGDGGLSTLPALVGALLAIVLLLDARPRGGGHSWASLAAASLPLALALETYRYRSVARTEIFSAPMLAVSLWAIRRHEDGHPRSLLVLPLLALLWTNLHPATAVALVPLALLVASGLAARLVRRLRPGPGAPSPSWSALGAALAALCATTLASAATPTPGNPVLSAVRFAVAALRLGGDAASRGDPALANVVRYVGEMQGGGLSLLGTPAGVLMVLAVLAFLARPRAARLREVLTVAAFAVLPFLAVRFAVFFAVVAAPIVARQLGAALELVPARVRGFPASAGIAIALGAASLATLPLGALAPHIRFGTGLAHGFFPVRGTEYLRALDFEGRLFNTFHFGGYLEWAGLSPFQDGRGGTRPEDTAAAVAGPTRRPLFASLDARYRFDALLVTYPAGDPASGAPFGVLDPDPELWSLVAFDDAGLLYLRRDGRYAGAAARDEYTRIRPSDPARLYPTGDLDGALVELRRSVVEAPDCHRCRYWLGHVALATGRPAEALSAVEPVLSRVAGDERAAFEQIVAAARGRSP